MLSNKAKYALRALGYLATKYAEGPVQIAEIAEQKKIPLKFLENILLELRKAEIVESKKGKGGGYFFCCRPKKNFCCQRYQSNRWPHLHAPLRKPVFL